VLKAGHFENVPGVNEERRVLGDPLDYLPFSTVREFRKGHLIYENHQVSSGLYLIIQGTVKVCRIAENTQQHVLIEIYKKDEFFGESALLGHVETGEVAIAFESIKLMAWTRNEIETLLSNRPKLGFALLQMMVQRSEDFSARIESLALDNVESRLAGVLIHFSQRFGIEIEDGVFKMRPLSHDLLAQHIGASRENVTLCLNRFRHQHLLEYSRKAFLIYRDALKDAVLAGIRSYDKSGLSL
jgi:CRP-like cAMP-binding protein